MKQPEVIAEILNNVVQIESFCPGCSSEHIVEMTDAAREIDNVVSLLADVGQAPPPEGEDGVRAALFYVRQTRSKILSLSGADLDERGLSALSSLLSATGEMARGFQL